MIKIISLLFIAIMSLNAETVNGGQNDPRLFGKLFFDYTVAGQKYFEYILAGNRKYMVIENRIVAQLKTADESNIAISVKGRIEIPSHIDDNSVMVRTINTKVYTGAWTYMYINDKKVTAKQTVFKIQTDTNGNRYLKFEIRGGTTSTTVVSRLLPGLPKFTVSIAPAKKKRGKDFQWETPKLYVIDE